MIFRSDVSPTALARFFAKLEVDPCHGFEGTACVLWTGGKSCGQGKTVKYGVLKDQGKRWYAHRWAASKSITDAIGRCVWRTFKQ
jgi:hypothetical protein